MKTPLQELIQYESDLTHMFDSDVRVAGAILEYIRTNKKGMLEKEKELIDLINRNTILPNPRAYENM
ncbi:hypothetical protein OAA23_00520 [bacterium]|nr:hypothetical protein [bacterium]